MILSRSPRGSCTTVSSRPPREYPIPTYRSSAVGSSMILTSGWRSAEAPSTKATPCLRRFVRSLAASHSYGPSVIVRDPTRHGIGYNPCPWVVPSAPTLCAELDHVRAHPRPLPGAQLFGERLGHPVEPPRGLERATAHGLTDCSQKTTSCSRFATTVTPPS